MDLLQIRWTLKAGDIRDIDPYPKRRGGGQWRAEMEALGTFQMTNAGHKKGLVLFWSLDAVHEKKKKANNMANVEFFL